MAAPKLQATASGQIHFLLKVDRCAAIVALLDL